MIHPASVAIIGAGPAGLMAAEVLARAGLRVSIYDRMPNPARKFLIAGRGGLNLTHSESLDLFIPRYGKSAQWMEPYVRAFTPDDLRAWCEGLGQETFVGSSGRVFPRSMKAVPLLRAWLQRLEELGVRYLPRHEWLGWHEEKWVFRDAAGTDTYVESDATLLALGGASWPRLGSDGGWVALLQEQGVRVHPLEPSNCGFVVPWSEHFASRFAGEPFKSIALSNGAHHARGEALITAQGLEGGAIYALSAPLREAIAQHGAATLHVDVRPDMSVEALAKKLAVRGTQSLSTYLKSAGLAPVVIALLWETTEKEWLQQANAMALAARLKALPITLTATAGMARAISSAGGIARDAVNDRLMLHAKEGVFVAGEMLDWEAPTGGYLLQGCFSTAVAAADGIIDYCSK